jgi:tRNA G18 (ribose-2'-O)-methylase SpoU
MIRHSQNWNHSFLLAEQFAASTSHPFPLPSKYQFKVHGIRSVEKLLQQFFIIVFIFISYSASNQRFESTSKGFKKQNKLIGSRTSKDISS